MRRIRKTQYGMTTTNEAIMIQSNAVYVGESAISFRTVAADTATMSIKKTRWWMRNRNRGLGGSAGMGRSAPRSGRGRSAAAGAYIRALHLGRAGLAAGTFGATGSVPALGL